MIYYVDRLFRGCAKYKVFISRGCGRGVISKRKERMICSLGHLVLISKFQTTWYKTPLLGEIETILNVSKFYFGDVA